MDVPCGHCAECQQMRKNEWFLRNYYESQDVWSKDGYIYFETLTYDDSHLPHILDHLLDFDFDSAQWYKIIDWMCANGLENDDIRQVRRCLRDNNYSCFNYRHVQNFLKDLRITLTRSGYDVGCLRFFLASEYGDDQIYVDDSGRTRRGTNRPHYHVLFYVSDPKLDPVDFARIVKDCWIYGNTASSYARFAPSFVRNYTFGPRYVKDPDRLRGVQYYTAKYVCKDSDFDSEIDRRICNIIRDVFHLSYSGSSSERYFEKRRELHRHMDQFHRQSVGFGFSALDSQENFDSIFNDAVLVVPDKEKVKKSFPVPMYYVRKLFQECVKDSEGSLHWVWNDLGKQWKFRCMERTVSVLSVKMQDWYSNLHVYTSEPENWRSKVDRVLQGRSWSDFARYFVYYRHRLYDGDVPDVSEVAARCLDACPEFGEYVFHKIGSGYVCADVSGNVYSFSVEDMWNNCVMDDSCKKEFRGFDYLYSVYCASMRVYNKLLEDAYEEKVRLSKVYKSLDMRTKRI